MCLKITQRCETAKEDIVCYKVLQRLDARTWATPNGTKLPGFNAWKNCDGYIQEIETGDFPRFKNLNDNLEYPGIHSFTSPQEPGINSIIMWDGIFQCFECIIPKGTKYYRGMVTYGNLWEDEWKDSGSYASERIIYKRLVVNRNQIDKI